METRYNPRELKTRSAILRSLDSPEGGSILFGPEYTGVTESLGAGRIYNTGLTKNQVMLALAMSNHPLIENAITSKQISPESLSNEQVLEGLVAVDLGCGKIPSFARTLRQLGAEVYTVDTIPAEEFHLADNYPTELRELEKRNHLPWHLSDWLTEDIIKQRVPNPDLITAAQLSTDGFHHAEKIAKKLLPKKGVFYEPLNPNGELKQAKEIRLMGAQKLMLLH